MPVNFFTAVKRTLSNAQNESKPQAGARNEAVLSNQKQIALSAPKAAADFAKDSSSTLSKLKREIKNSISVLNCEKQENPAYAKKAPAASVKPASAPSSSTPAAEERTAGKIAPAPTPSQESTQSAVQLPTTPANPPVRISAPAAETAATGKEICLTSPAGKIFSGMAAAPSRAEQLHAHLNAALFKLCEKDQAAVGAAFADSNLSRLGLKPGTARETARLENEIIRLKHKFRTKFEAAYKTAMNAKGIDQLAGMKSRDYIACAKSAIEGIFIESQQLLAEASGLIQNPETRRNGTAMLDDIGFDYNFQFYARYVSADPARFAALETFNVHQEQMNFVEFDGKKGLSADNLQVMMQSPRYQTMKAAVADHVKTGAAAFDMEKDFKDVLYATEFAKETGAFLALWEGDFSREFDNAVLGHAPDFFRSPNAFMKKVASTTMKSIRCQFDMRAAAQEASAGRFQRMSRQLESALTGTIRALGAAMSQPKTPALEAAPSSVRIEEIVDYSAIAEATQAVAPAAAQAAIPALPQPPTQSARKPSKKMLTFLRAQMANRPQVGLPALNAPPAVALTGTFAAPVAKQAASAPRDMRALKLSDLTGLMPVPTGAALKRMAPLAGYRKPSVEIPTINPSAPHVLTAMARSQSANETPAEAPVKVSAEVQAEVPAPAIESIPEEAIVRSAQPEVREGIAPANETPAFEEATAAEPMPAAAQEKFEMPKRSWRSYLFSSTRRSARKFLAYVFGIKLQSRKRTT